MVMPAAFEIPTAFKEKRYIRMGLSKCNIKDYLKREIELFKILDGRIETIETIPAKYQELTFQKLFGYYGLKGIFNGTGRFTEHVRKNVIQFQVGDGKAVMDMVLLTGNHVGEFGTIPYQVP